MTSINILFIINLFFNKHSSKQLKLWAVNDLSRASFDTHFWWGRRSERVKKKATSDIRLHIETLTDSAEETFWMIDRSALDYE